MIDVRHLVGGNEYLTSRDGREDARHWWVLVLSEPDDQVVDAAEASVGAVEQIASGDKRDVDHTRL